MECAIEWIFGKESEREREREGGRGRERERERGGSRGQDLKNFIIRGKIRVVLGVNWWQTLQHTLGRYCSKHCGRVHSTQKIEN